MSHESTPNESQSSFVSWRRGIDPIIDTDDKIRAFHSNPGVYAIIFQHSANDRKVPINFAYIDCSSFLFDSFKTEGRSIVIGGLIFEITMTIARAFLPKSTSVQHEPLLFRINK